jgi:hypothetical protein
MAAAWRTRLGTGREGHLVHAQKDHGCVGVGAWMGVDACAGVGELRMRGCWGR